MILKEFSDWQEKGLGYKKVSQEDSSDAQIIKGIYNALKYLELELSWDILCGEPYVDMLDAYNWLEKQSEQKPTENPAWSEEDEGMLKWLCRIIHSQRVGKVITLKEESELGEWMDKWLNYNQQAKQDKKLDVDKACE